MEKARDLCDHVTKKGPRASQMFITYICNEDCYLAEILELQSGKNLHLRPSGESIYLDKQSLMYSFLMWFQDNSLSSNSRLPFLCLWSCCVSHDSFTHILSAVCPVGYICLNLTLLWWINFLCLSSGPSAETVFVTEDSKGGHPFSSGTHTGRGKTPSRPSSCLPFSHGVNRGWGALCN